MLIARLILPANRNKFCKGKANTRAADPGRVDYGFSKGDKYGIPDRTWSRIDDGALRVDHRRLCEAARVVIIKGGTISHGLATALIDKDGKIDKIWRGNGWTPAGIVHEISGRK